MIQKKKFILFFNINFSILRIRNKGEIMTKEDLKKYKEFLQSLNEKDKKNRRVYEWELASDKRQGPKTGYPSIDKPWLKEYTKEQIESKIPRTNIYETLKDYNKDRLDSIALEYEFVKITYKEMFQKIDEAANSLAAMGIKKGDVITSTIANTPEAYYVIYGAAKIGAVVDLIDPLTNAELLAKYCNNANSKMFITLDIMSENAIKNLKRCGYSTVVTVSPTESLPIPNETEKMIRFNDKVISWGTFLEKGKENSIETIPYEKDLPFAILHTGGTSGVPKGVLLSHDNLNAQTLQVLDSPLKMEPNETVLHLMPPFTSFGICYGTHVHLCAGLKLILIPTYNPEIIGEQVFKYKPNRLACSPAHIEGLLNSPLLKNCDLSFLHKPLEGGDTLALKIETGVNDLLLKNGCKDRVVKGYGLTECCGSVSFCITNEVNKLLSSGVPLSKTVVAAFSLDNYDEELPYGEIGEIAVLSQNNMLEYLNNPEETKKTLKKHSDGTTWLHTGDLGKIDSDGILFVVGRLRRMIIQYCGLKANPFEAEEAIIEHPLVKKAAVVGAKDFKNNQGEIPVAFIEIDKDNFDKEELIKKEILDICNKKVTYYSIPVDYIFVDHYPLTSRGKVDYRKLSEIYNEQYKNREIIPQRRLKV